MRKGCCCRGNECYTNAYISLVVSQKGETYFECDSFTPTEIWNESGEYNSTLYFFADTNIGGGYGYQGYNSGVGRGNYTGNYSRNDESLSEVNAGDPSAEWPYFPTEVGEPNYLHDHRWHKDETEEFGNLFCMLNEDVFHPKVSASKYGITPEMRADDVSGGQIDERGKVRVGLEMALHYKWYDPNETQVWTKDKAYHNFDYYDSRYGSTGGYSVYVGSDGVEYPACVDNPSQYIESDEFISGIRVDVPFEDDKLFGNLPLKRFFPGLITEDNFEDAFGNGVPCFIDPSNLENPPWGNDPNPDYAYWYQQYEQGIGNQGGVYCSDWFIRQENNVPPSCSAARCVTSEQLCEWIKSPESQLTSTPRGQFEKSFSCFCSPHDPWTPNAVSSRCCGEAIYAGLPSGAYNEITGPDPAIGYSTGSYEFPTSAYTIPVYIDTSTPPYETLVGERQGGGYYYYTLQEQWMKSIPYTCPPKPPTCLGAERPGLPGLEYIFKEVSPKTGDTRGELNGLSEIVDYTYNKIIQRFGPTILPNGKVNPLPNSIVIQSQGGPSISIDEIGYTVSVGGSFSYQTDYGMFVDFAEALFQKYVDEHGVDIAIQRFSTCGVDHPQEYGSDGCIGFDCLEPTLENHGKAFMGYKRASFYPDFPDYPPDYYSNPRQYTPCAYFNTNYPADATNPHPLGISDPLGLRFNTLITPWVFNKYVDRFDYIDDPDGNPVETLHQYGLIGGLYGGYGRFHDRFLAYTGVNGIGLGTLFYSSPIVYGSYGMQEYNERGYVHKLWSSLENWLCPNCSVDERNEFIDRDKFNKYFPNGNVDNLRFLDDRMWSTHPDTSFRNDYAIGDSTRFGQTPKSDLIPGATGYFYPGYQMGEQECYYRDKDGEWWDKHRDDYYEALCQVFPDDFFCDDWNFETRYWIDPDEAVSNHNPNFGPSSWDGGRVIPNLSEEYDPDLPRQDELGGHSFTYKR